jgi:hypothetical protein
VEKKTEKKSILFIIILFHHIKLFGKRDKNSSALPKETTCEAILKKTELCQTRLKQQ